ncbi:hypothetical protein [Marinomonas algarum]|uniref:Uncharacterized protein n=1 Tax=Marinomonas algarum TaxID=2883105 RepID=A0A9X1IPU2_9GAMM|nr:hypothetical protein [Marinomonas algarum]MCB5162829.1 hypothetical protein [Marinomonas algarum]
MNASPITSWEGATAYFTFANNPTMMSIILTLSVLVTVGIIVASVVHENKTYIDYQ